MSEIRLNLESKEGSQLKENFLVIQGRLNKDLFMPGNWRVIEVVFSAAVTAQPIMHNLGFQPTDAIVTSKSTTATVDFVYTSFTATNVYITTSAAVTVRFLVGRF